MPLITLTSGIGCSEGTVARLLGDQLGMPVYDDQRLQHEALVQGVSVDDLKNLDEKAPGLFNRLLNFKPQAYREVMEAVILAVAGRDAAIILGHGAPFLLRDFGCALHVRLYASLSSRVEIFSEEQGMGTETAKKIIEKSDNDRRGFMEYAFQMNWDDPALYDLIVNRDKLGTEGAVHLIMAMEGTEQFATCSLTALDSMERLSLAKKVEAAIMKTMLNPQNFDVDVPEKGVVRLSGIINPLESEDKLLDAVRSVPGVTDVRPDIAVERIHDI